MKFSLITPYRKRTGQFENLVRLINIVKKNIFSINEIIVSEYGVPDKRLDNLDVKIVREYSISVWNRSRSVNNGVEKAKNKYIVILDSDCIPIIGLDIVLQHLHKRKKAVILWSLNGDAIDLHSTGNFSIERDYFYKLGGLDENYKGYGREDKDLEIRLLKEKEVMYLPFFLLKDDRRTKKPLSKELKYYWRKNKIYFKGKHGRYSTLKVDGGDIFISSNFSKLLLKINNK